MLEILSAWRRADSRADIRKSEAKHEGDYQALFSRDLDVEHHQSRRHSQNNMGDDVDCLDPKHRGVNVDASVRLGRAQYPANGRALQCDYEDCRDTPDDDEANEAIERHSHLLVRLDGDHQKCYGRFRSRQ